MLSYFLKICFVVSQNSACKVREYFRNRSFYEATKKNMAEIERARREREREREREAPQSQWESQLNMAQQSRRFVKHLQLIFRTHLVGSVVSDNTEFVFRSPVKSSYLSLLLIPQIACGPTQPSVYFLPLSPTTQVHMLQSAGTIARRRAYTNFIDAFAQFVKRLLSSS